MIDETKTRFRLTGSQNNLPFARTCFLVYIFVGLVQVYIVSSFL